MTVSPALLTDRYELTMVEAALRAGIHDRPSVFEAFARRLPGGRRYGVVAGVGRILELVRDFRFGDTELEFLAREKVVDEPTLQWLANYRFTGNIHGYAEGELYFPNSPLLTVESSFAEAVVLETLILSVLNYDSAVATAASRMVSAAGGRPLAEMGGRRTNERAAVAAARAAYIAGFDATSNLEAGRLFGVPTMGTAAHAFTMLFDSEEAAFQAQIAALGSGTTLLVDTYDVMAALETAVKLAGPELGAVRLDSGDLISLVKQVRARLDELGAPNTKITVTSDLDEYAIAALAASPVDSYGVGTRLVTGSGTPAAGIVYKLVARMGDDGNFKSVAKASAGKVGLGGRKQAARRRSASGVATAEIVSLDDSKRPAQNDRELTVPLMLNGQPHEQYLGAAGVERARKHLRIAVAELPQQALRLTGGDPALPTIYSERNDS